MKNYMLEAMKLVRKHKLASTVNGSTLDKISAYLQVTPKPLLSDIKQIIANNQ